MPSKQDAESPGRELLALIEAAAAETAGYLAGPLVEPKGILSRVEQHLVHVRDQYLVTTGEQDRVLTDIRMAVQLGRSEAVARHEFLRDFLVQMDQRLAKLDHAAFRVAVMERLDVVSARMAAIVVRLDSLLAGMDKMDRRLSALEDMAEAIRANSANRHNEVLRRLPDGDG